MPRVGLQFVIMVFPDHTRLFFTKLGGSVGVGPCLLLLPLWDSVVVLCFSFALLCVHSRFAIILMGKRELVALLCLPSWRLVIVMWLLLTMPWVCLHFVIVVIPGNTHLKIN